MSDSESPPGKMAGSDEHEGPRPKPANPSVWLLRGATAVMLLVAIVMGVRKFGTTPEQEELARYAELTVPVYLAEVAAVEERLDRLNAPPALTAEEARKLLVNEVMPLVIKARKHATQVVARSAPVKKSNDEYIAALDQLMDVGRAGVRAIDDPQVAGEEGHRQMVERRRAAEAAVRAWMAQLRERCKAAGLKLAPAAGKAASATAE